MPSALQGQSGETGAGLLLLGPRLAMASNAAALAVATRLSESKETACRWVGKDALRDLANPKVLSRLVR
jgi:hypothetical protein